MPCSAGLWSSQPAPSLGLPVVENLSLGLDRMVWGVSALVHAVSDALAARFAACTVSGEISGFSRAASGHCYLSLKDADGGAALIRCAMFRRAASLLDFAPAEGAQFVEARRGIQPHTEACSYRKMEKEKRATGEGGACGKGVGP